jgi:predicted NUDIX family NTP pyrophosphohydrolase
MPKQSAGLLVYRGSPPSVEVLLVHPGGPYWSKKGEGAWSIPKGLYTEPEDPLRAARREFEEEVGRPVTGDFIALGEFKQPGGKIVTAWAVESDVSVSDFTSNSFQMEWPPRSGKFQCFPEVDRAAWFDLGTALKKLTKGQTAILHVLARRLGIEVTPSGQSD